jgi:predicted dehydrogenase
LVAAGELGRVRVVQVEYPQQWLTTALEQTGHKQAAWRTDPAQSGAGCLGDIGTHAYQLARFVTGLSCTEVAADVSTFVSDRRVDDNVHVLLRFADGARGMLWASQVAPGNDNNLRLRVYGDKAGLEWRQEDPNYLWLSPLGEMPRQIRRGGHPEGYLEAFAQLYTDLAEQITAHRERRAPNPASLIVPGIEDGVEGMQFIAAVLESSRSNSAWVAGPRGVVS